MGIFNFISTTLPSIFKRPATCCYPKESRPVYDGLKGQITIKEDDCILCGKCQKACPADAIEVLRKESVWQIDHYRCVTCFSCVRACPKKCLEMSSTRAHIARKMDKDSHNIPKKAKHKDSEQ